MVLNEDIHEFDYLEEKSLKDKIKAFAERFAKRYINILPSTKKRSKKHKKGK